MRGIAPAAIAGEKQAMALEQQPIQWAPEPPPVRWAQLVQPDQLAVELSAEQADEKAQVKEPEQLALEQQPLLMAQAEEIGKDGKPVTVIGKDGKPISAPPEPTKPITIQPEPLPPPVKVPSVELACNTFLAACNLRCSKIPPARGIGLAVRGLCYAACFASYTICRFSGKGPLSGH